MAVRDEVVKSLHFITSFLKFLYRFIAHGTHWLISKFVNIVN